MRGRLELSKPLRVLIIEDSEDDALMLMRELERGGYTPTSERVETAEAMTAALEKQAWDIIVADYRLPHFSAPEALDLFKETELDLPFIVVSGTIGEETAVSIMKAGAHDYVMKDNLKRLVPAIERELYEAGVRKERKLIQEDLRIAEQNFRNSLNSSPLGIRIVSAEGELLYANQAILDIYGYSSVEELKATPTKERYTHESYAEHQERKGKRKRGNPVENEYEISIVRKDGGIRYLSAVRRAVVWNGEVQFQAIYQDVTERKLMEEDMRIKDSAIASSINGVALADLNGNLTYANNSFLKMWGYDNDKEVLGKPATEFWQSKEKALEVIKALRDRQGWIGELVAMRKDGSTFDMSLTASIVTDKVGKPICMMVSFADVTERKQAEERLRESEEKLETILENTNDIIFQLSPLGTIQYVSPKAIELYGYKPEDLIGKHLRKTTPARELPKALKVLKSVMSGKVISDFEINQLDTNGRIVPVEINVTPVRKDGKIIAVQGVIRDITQRKEAQDRIKRAAEEWRTTFDSITDFISIQDRDFKVTRVNKAFADILKMKPEKLIGKTCYELIHGTNEPVPACPHMKTLETKKPATAAFFEPCLEMYLEISTSPIFNEEGEVVASVHVARDSTERKKMEEQLIVTDRLVSIGELSSGIAHELNNPLTSVIGFSELLLGKDDLTDDVKEDLKVVNREAKRTAEVVRNLLIFARKHPEEKQSVDINKVIQGVLEIRAYEQSVNNIEVNARFAPDLPDINANGFELQQVFINIIINAEHFMTEAHGRGTLTITTERVSNNVKASFVDDGPGIAEDNLGHLFEPFFTTKEVGKGTGLGLSICHGIITSHGGRIYAESELGKGTTFVIELPIGKK